MNTTSSAKAEHTCDQVLKLCDAALQDERKLNYEQQSLIKLQDERNALQDTKIKELTQDNKPILRSPYLWGALGFIGGILLVK